MAEETPHNDGLWDFLRKRGVAEENINRMQQDKIDTSLIREIEDAYLARYIPVYGDRIATRRYCLDKQKRKEDKSSRMPLLEKLQKKMRRATASHGEESEEEPWPARKASYDRSKNARKSSRKIELGWIHDGKQVRKRSGGGTRVLEVSKDSTKKDLMSHAKELFFPHGESKKGKWEDFIHNIYDFKESELDESTTVGELYTLSKFGILRFYLNTTCYVDTSDTEVDSKMDRHGDTKGEQQRQTDSDEHQEKPVSVNESQTEPSGTAEDSSVHSAVVEVVDLTSQSYDSEVFIGGLVAVSSASQLDDTVPVFLSTDDIISVALSTSTPVLGDRVDHAVHSSDNAHYAPLSEIQLDDTVPVFTLTEEVFSVVPSTSTPVFGDRVDHAVHSSGNTHYDPLSEIQLHDAVPVFTPAAEVISIAPSTAVSEDHVQHTDHSSFDAGYELLYVGIKLHRVNLLEEMIGQFKDESILNYPLKYSFINEKGADADGVARDVYAAFWTEFLDCAAEGAEMRVPSLSPKWQEEEWKAVGRILAKGFLDQGYFPLRLAPAFTTALIFGEHAVSTDVLFESLLLYLSQCERDLITTALQEDIDSDGQDELLDLLDRLGVKMVPPRDNLKAVLLQVAHKQIIQQPKYALDAMSSVAGQHLRTTITTTAKMQVMYADKKPTCRKVLKLIEASPVTPAERQALRFLQQYIRGLDEVGLRKLLRFVTGSDIICVTRIEVIFTALEGLARRPVAHTCGSVLELPCTYNSYPELRVEMENVLTSNYYTMDIV